MEKATIYDYARMCKANVHKCENCPMWNYTCAIAGMNSTDVDKANEIILKWCKEHLVETRQDKFLKMFPKTETKKGVVMLCPNRVDLNFKCPSCTTKCEDCCTEYWLAEVDE